MYILEVDSEFNPPSCTFQASLDPALAQKSKMLFVTVVLCAEWGVGRSHGRLCTKPVYCPITQRNRKSNRGGRHHILQPRAELSRIESGTKSN